MWERMQRNKLSVQLVGWVIRRGSPRETLPYESLKKEKPPRSSSKGRWKSIELTGASNEKRRGAKCNGF